MIKYKWGYEAALEKLSIIMDKEPIPGSKEEELLELLLLTIEDFEERNKTS